MADYTWNDETTTRRVFSLPSPTNMTEISKAMSAISANLKDLGIEYYDDTVSVEAWDDEIRLSFEISDSEVDR